MIDRQRVTLGIILWLGSILLPSGIGQEALRRIPWTTSRLAGSPDPPSPYRVERIYPNLTFDSPVSIVKMPGQSRLLVLQRDGKVFFFQSDDSAAKAELFADLKHADPDLNAAYDVVFHPDFPENQFVFFVWSQKPDERVDGSRVVRFRLTADDPPRLDLESRTDIFTWPAGGHNGSCLRFGPDGMFYVTMGDGAGPFPPDPYRTGQDLADVRGSILRIDVDHPVDQSPYSIPHDNPFVDHEGARGEIYAFGFRNPWRIAFDPVTGSLWTGDVGWELWEMVYRVHRGGNYGWSLTEGPQPIHPNDPPGPGPVIPPAVALPHTQSNSITGGIVVRDARPSSLVGRYVFGDYVNGSIWAAELVDGRLLDYRLIASSGLAIISFASIDVDASSGDDVVVLDFGGGIYRLVENHLPDTSESFPRLLSQTGLFASTVRLTPATGVLRYDVAAAMHRDGATGDRMLAIPGDQTIQTNSNRVNWSFPKGTVLANTIHRECIGPDETVASRRIETQVLMFDGSDWQPYTYRWNAQQTDAELVDASGDDLRLRVVDERFRSREIRHRLYSREQCRVCHHSKVPGGIGFTPEFLQAASDDSAATTWHRLLDSGWVTERRSKSNTRPMCDPKDKSQPLERRARSYLAANCAHCHMRGGGGTAAVVLSMQTPDDKLNAIDQPVSQGGFGIPGAKVIVPGNPAQSVLYYRLATIGPGHMPRLGATHFDADGVTLIHEWIKSLGSGDDSTVESEVVNALRLQHELIPLPPDQARDRATGYLGSRGDAVTAGLLEPFLPPDERSQRIGPNPDEAKLLKLTGDATRGRRWFADSPASQCRSCHIAGGVGQNVGPALDGISTIRTRPKLLASMLRPSEEIAPEWSTFAVLTDDGRQLVGLKMEEDDQSVTLRTTDGKTRRINRDEIEQIKKQDQSLMPTGLVESMTEEELVDLLSYLQSL